MKWDTLVVCIVMITLKMFDVIAMNDLKARVDRLEQKPNSAVAAPAMGPRQPTDMRLPHPGGRISHPRSQQ